MADRWHYEKLDEKGNIVQCPRDDKDKSTTGKFILNVPAYFDENPAERIRLGWIKHIDHDASEIEYNKQTQYLVTGSRQIDEYTVETVYHVMNKSEEQMHLEEMFNAIMGGDSIAFN